MRRVLVLAVALVASLTPRASSAAKEPANAPTEETPRVDVRVDRAGNAVRVDARFDGALRDVAILRRSDGAPRIVALVGPPTPSGADRETTAPAAPCDPRSGAEPSETEAKPGRLFRLDPSGEGTLELVRDDVPAAVTRLVAVDADGDGNDEMALVRPGRVEVARDGPGGAFRGPIETWIEDAGVDVPLERGGLTDVGTERQGPRLRFASVRAVESFVPAPGSERWKILSKSSLPVESDDGRDALRVRSPVPRPVAGKNAPPIWATPAEVVGPDRIRFWLLEPDAPEARRAVECWARLPGRERILDQRLVMLDDAPALVVTTMSAEKLAIFGEKSIRVYRPAPDRTRTGAAPILAAVTSLNLWQTTVPLAADVDGDGRDDLVLPYWKGLKNSIVAFDVFLRKSDGTFAESPRTSSFDVEDGDRSFLLFGPDFDGDGVGDLLLRSGKGLRVHPGLRDTRSGKRIVAEPATCIAPLPDDLSSANGYQVVGMGAEGIQSWTVEGPMSPPSPVALDDRGPASILIRGNDSRGHGRLLLVRCPSAPAPGAGGPS